ncbi:MAG: hypothetical protein HND40_13120 [Ignavibacteriota bacterium]|jgi:hypothetical protein|nr:hypothetical protein [Ignavibacterium sp.]MCO6447712.1 hypothetical protein [Ignavibacterium album]MCZ2268428.1 hypothetical protein [Ignavibacteriales bacterium]MDX9711678.1 hypothetical protein [Ignavibacteriaceae bacterium]QKK00443.1 MAG: hypothetical protein HND40_13120 [Ignavibacteriota bacterium]
MKKKRNQKQRQSDPNQLSFDFSKENTSINVHIPKSSATILSSQFISAKRLAIRLAES